MRFTEKQRLVLFTAWKQGHLSGNKNYGTISKVTGLTRKQISNWARTKINKLANKPPPKKGDTPLISIFYELPLNMRTSLDYSTFLDAESVPRLCDKNRNSDPTCTKVRFTSQQRKVLIIAWEKGFLCDRKNYAEMSEITGLTRKQISNWARARVNRSRKGNLPQKNNAPLSTIFKQLAEGIEGKSISNPPKARNFINHDTQHLKHEPKPLNGISSQCELSSASILSHQCPPLPVNELSFIGNNFNLPQLTSQIASPCVKSHITANPSSRKRGQWSNDNLFPTFNDSCHGFTLSNEICAESSNGVSDNSSAIPLSPVKQWILKNSLKKLNAVDDEKVEVLAVLTCTSHSDIIDYLLQHGWDVHPAPTGFHYVRSVTKGVISSNYDSLCGK